MPVGKHSVQNLQGYFKVFIRTYRKGFFIKERLLIFNIMVTLGIKDKFYIFKIIDISRMLAKAAQSQAERQAERELEEGGGMKNHPVIRTMYDHDLVRLNGINTYSFMFFICCSFACFYFSSLCFFFVYCVFIVNFEHISHILLVFPLLNLTK